MSQRVKNVKRNLSFEVFARTGSFLLTFLSRAIFLRYLGEDYLGVNGYYTNVLQILNLSELGLANVAMYHLYKPLAENDVEQIRSLEEYYKKLYQRIAFFILAVGLSLAPFIDRLVKVQEEIPDLKLYYVISLLNIVASYLFIHKNTILNASQHQYIYNTSSVIFNFLMQIVQIGVLTIRRDYALYLLVQVFCTAANMIYINYRADKLFPFLREKHAEPLDSEEKKHILHDVKAMSPYKIGEGILSYSDNLFITLLINTTMIGFYTNYFSLTNVLTTMGGVIYNAVFPSVGDYNVSSNETQKKQVFNLIFFGYLWISMFFASGFISMASDIIKVWLGEKYVLGMDVVVAMSMNVFLSLIVCPVNVYRITTGIFRKTKGILIYSAILNILFSYFLGSRFGLVGIIIATSLARLLTQFWFEPVVLYKEVFPSSHVSAYFGRIAGAAAVALTSSFAVDQISAVLPLAGLSFVIVKFLMACLIPNLLFFLIFWKDPSMRQMKDIIIRRVSMIARK